MYEDIKNKIRIHVLLGSLELKAQTIINGWTLKPLERAVPDIQDVNATDKKQEEYINIFLKTLEKSDIDLYILKCIIEINSSGIASDKDYLKLTQEFDIVHQKTYIKFPKNEVSVHKLKELSKKCTVIVPAVSSKRPPLPPDFPVTMVIAVGCKDAVQNKSLSSKTDLVHKESSKNKSQERVNPISSEKGIELLPQSSKSEAQPLLQISQAWDEEEGEEQLKQKPGHHWQSAGSTLDFVCVNDAEEKIHDPWAASYYVTAIATLIIFKAYSMSKYHIVMANNKNYHILINIIMLWSSKYRNRSDKQFLKIDKFVELTKKKIQKLKKTKVMHRVLCRMCRRRDSPSTKHTIYDGWGILDPWDIINNPNKLSELIEQCIDKEETIHWNGKNL